MERSTIKHQDGHCISQIVPESIADDLGIRPGDFLLAINGHPLIDIFDYRMRQLESHLVLAIRRGGRLIEYELDKEEDEDLGLEFANPMMQDCASCDNHCIFCFVDQLPSGMRSSLYFKDDDLRLSFLSGNYATLTNLSDEALDRLIAYRFSPMNISVHTTDPVLRRKMVRHRDAGNILAKLQRIAAAGLMINAQIVLCPGINDGPALDKTLSDLTGLGSSLNSIALVPVGITRYRAENKLFPLRPFSAADAVSLLDQATRWQDLLLDRQGTRMVYAADEFYILAGRPFPSVSFYEDFPQLENGVGMAASMMASLEQALASPEPTAWQPVHLALPGGADTLRVPDELILATGTAAAPLLERYVRQLQQRLGRACHVQPVVNRFFGETVTVAGLLTGQDLVAQLRPAVTRIQNDRRLPAVLVPDCLLKSDEPVLLDDMTLDELSSLLSVPVMACRADGEALTGLIDYLACRKEVTRI